VTGAHQLTPFGKYHLLDRINVGGMAEVFRAKAFGVEGFEKLLAVKRIMPDIGKEADFARMFIDEAKIGAQLTHANIVQVFDLGAVDGLLFIAMEYVHGKDLRAIMERIRNVRGVQRHVGGRAKENQDVHCRPANGVRLMDTL
jgi:serine/threonine protein kinase